MRRLRASPAGRVVATRSSGNRGPVPGWPAESCACRASSGKFGGFVRSRHACRRPQSTSPVTSMDEPANVGGNGGTSAAHKKAAGAPRLTETSANGHQAIDFVSEEDVRRALQRAKKFTLVREPSSHLPLRDSGANRPRCSQRPESFEFLSFGLRAANQPRVTRNSETGKSEETFENYVLRAK